MTLTRRGFFGALAALAIAKPVAASSLTVLTLESAAESVNVRFIYDETAFRFVWRAYGSDAEGLRAKQKHAWAERYRRRYARGRR